MNILRAKGWASFVIVHLSVVKIYICHPVSSRVMEYEYSNDNHLAIFKKYLGKCP